MVVKAPKGMDLEHLWHGSKSVWVGLILVSGILTWRHVGWLLFDRGGNELKKERAVLMRFIVATIAGAVGGFFIRDALYQYWKTIEWWRFPWA